MTSMPNIDYETTVFTLKPDHIGPNKATLLHARTQNGNNETYKAVLYLHGYTDYFFHDHLCQHFLDHGYDFYALDLRKSGRSIISPEHDRYISYCRDLHEYHEEITLAIEHIIQQANNQKRKIVLLGHSTGGLTATLYARTGVHRSEIDALILSSPYFPPMEFSFLTSILIKIIIFFGLIVYVDPGWSARSLHVSHGGEWDFDEIKKPMHKMYFSGHYCGAVAAAQQELSRKQIPIHCPILLLCSDRFIRQGKVWHDDYAEAEIILNVTKMRQIGATLGNQVTIFAIEKAVHDIFLSKKPVREYAFERTFTWLKHVEETWTTSETNSQ